MKTALADNGAFTPTHFQGEREQDAAPLGRRAHIADLLTRVRLVVAVLLLCALVAGILRSWLSPALAWDRLPDGPNHLVRVFVLDAALRRGEWFPRWLSDLYLGYGYPLFNFYAPGTYYLAEGLHQLGLSIYAALQGVGALAVVLGAAGVFTLVRRLAGGVLAPLLAAACYVAAPYPFLTNLFVRGAVPEALALGLLPWLLVAGTGCWQRGGAWRVVLAGCTAALLLIHNLTSLVGITLLGAWLAALFATGAISAGGGREGQLRAARRTLVAVLAGFGLTAWFWLPAAAETRYVQIDLAQGGLYDYHHWLFDPLAAVGALGRPDYPHSRIGPADLKLVFDYAAIGAGWPEKPSAGQLLAWCFAAVVPVVPLASRRVSRIAGAPAAALMAWTWAALAGLCWFLNTSWSLAFWEHLLPLQLSQFPWRFYGPLALCLAVAFGAAVAAVPPSSLGGRVARALATLVVLVLAYGALANRPRPVGPPPAHDVDARTLAALETDRYGAGTTSGGEFLPRTVGWPEFADGNKAGLRLYDRLFPEAGWQAGLVRVLSGSATISGIAQQPGWLAADVDTQDAISLGVHQLVFPGWRAFIDGVAAPITPASAPLVDPKTGVVHGVASLGFITVPVPPGRHHVEVRFGATPARLLAGAISAGTLAAVCLWALARIRGPKSEVRSPKPAGRQRAPSPRFGHGGRPSLYAYGAICCAAAGVTAWWSVLATGPVKVPSPGSSRVALDLAGTLDPRNLAEPAQFVTIAGQPRRALLMPVPSQTTVAARLPAHAFLQAGLAPGPANATSPDGPKGVRFIAEVAGSFGRRRVLDRTIELDAWSRSPSWIDVWVDLESLAGQDVTIWLRAEPAGNGPGGDPGGDAGRPQQAFWAHPQIVRWASNARPFPGTQHLW